MRTTDPRTELKALAAARGDSLAALSRMLRRNVNYLEQWVRTGSPRMLADGDRRALADYFGVEEAVLGGPPAVFRAIRRDIAASAGSGAVNGDDLALGAATVSPELRRSLGLQPGKVSVIRVKGDSMAPGLADGDELLVDEAKRAPDAKGGIFVLRIGGALFVKRVHRTRDRLTVTSDNPAAPPVPDGDPDIIGRAVWQMRRVM